MKSLSKIEVIVEKNDGLLWGRVEDKDKIIFTPFGENKEKLLENLKEMISEYVHNEGENDEYWQGLEIEKTEFELMYDLQAFFQEHEYLNLPAIAKIAGLGDDLIKQYASGDKYASAEETKKIEEAIHKIAKELQEVAIYS